MSPEDFIQVAARVEAELRKLIVGQDQVVRDTLVALMVGGHVLLEGVPGLGKTSLVRALSQVLELAFSRIQFTPDLMPADITGTTLIQEDEGGRRFRFQPGPVFANLVLADEVNRATPKVQSALARGHAGAHGHCGWEYKAPALAFFCPGDPKPDRAGRDVPLA